MGGPSLVLTGDARPLKEVRRRVEQALKNADTRELLEVIGLETVTATIRRFDQGVTPDGEKWPVALAAREEGRKTLIKTGQLQDSYTCAVSPSGDQVEVGSNLKYAAIHHFGGEIRAKNAPFLHFTMAGGGGGRHVMVKAVNIPARPALGLNADDEASLLQTTEDWIAEIVRGFEA